jgi:hypothetical protein
MLVRGQHRDGGERHQQARQNQDGTRIGQKTTGFRAYPLALRDVNVLRLGLQPEPSAGGHALESINLLYGAGLVLASLAVLKGVQAIAEHYFPNSEGVVAARFILGGP